MGFNILPKAPELSEMIEPAEPGEHMVIAPSLDFFRDELNFWRNDRISPPSLRKALQNDIRFVAFGRSDIEDMINRVIPYDAKSIGDWYMYGTAAVAWSRMWREIIDYAPDTPFSESLILALSGVVVDIDSNDPWHSGLHLSEEYSGQLVNIESTPDPGKTLWLEGKSVFLQVRSPAEPTMLMTERYGDTFPADDLTSFVPRLKAEVWH